MDSEWGHGWDDEGVAVRREGQRAVQLMVKRERRQSIRNRQRRVTWNPHGRSELAPPQTPVSSRTPHHPRVSSEPTQRTASSNGTRTSIRKLIEIICSITITKLMQISVCTLRSWLRETVVNTVKAKQLSQVREVDNMRLMTPARSASGRTSLSLPRKVITT